VRRRREARRGPRRCDASSEDGSVGLGGTGRRRGVESNYNFTKGWRLRLGDAGARARGFEGREDLRAESADVGGDAGGERGLTRGIRDGDFGGGIERVGFLRGIVLGTESPGRGGVVDGRRGANRGQSARGEGRDDGDVDVVASVDELVVFGRRRRGTVVFGHQGENVGRFLLGGFRLFTLRPRGWVIAHEAFDDARKRWSRLRLTRPAIVQ